MADLDKKLSSAPLSPIQGHTLLTVKEIDAQYRITFDDGAVLGEVNASLEKALFNITEQQYELEFEVFAPVRGTESTRPLHAIRTLTLDLHCQSDT
jgi:SWI/SNF-related matrix-associated actin-dependent regulator of chromatin subfamily A3